MMMMIMMRRRRRRSTIRFHQKWRKEIGFSLW